MQLADVGRVAGTILDEIEKAVIGKRDALELLMLGVLADGHVLIEDYPGLAKTLMARSFAQATSMDFSRIQFTPDLMPSDVTGSSIYNQRDGDFEFRPGPIFTNLLLADEINRAPPKTQAALLEAMQERQVTSEGSTRPLGPPFLVLATQNPIEYEGTYPLPEAQLDRFLLRMSVGYPSREDEWQVLAERAERRQDEVSSRRSSTSRDAARAASRVRGGACVGARRALHGRHRQRDPRRAGRAGRRLAARIARAAEAVALPRRARRPRLRDARRREGGRSARARPSPHAPSRALGAAHLGRRTSCASGSRRCRRPPRKTSPRREEALDPEARLYASLSAVGLLTALVFGRPELVALTAPFLLALAAGLALATTATLHRRGRARRRAGARGRRDRRARSA